MGAYIGLLLGIFLIRIFFDSSLWGKNRSKKYFLFFSFVLIFLIFALRSDTVGRDVPGYRRIYLDIINHPFSDFGYVYYEKGYQLLSKICCFLGLSWQIFLSIVSAMILIPIYIFIKKYSKNVFLSTLIFVCYMYFEFNLTAIRQAIASSICLIAYMVLMESKHKKTFVYIEYIFVVTIAVCFHKSAFAAYFLLPIMFIQSIKGVALFVTLASISCIAVRSKILTIIKTLFMKESLQTDAGLYLGGNLVFLIFLAALFVVVEINRENVAKRDYSLNNQTKINELGIKTNFDYQNIFVRSFILSIFFIVLFGMAASVRSYMILNQVIIASLPNAIENLETRSKQLAIVFSIFFFILFFYTNTLIPNSFDILPYEFFWSN